VTSSQPGFPTSFQLVRLCGLRPLLNNSSSTASHSSSYSGKSRAQYP